MARAAAVPFAIVFASVVASGVQYVWLWGRKALAERGGRPRPGDPPLVSRRRRTR